VKREKASIIELNRPQTESVLNMKPDYEKERGNKENSHIKRKREREGRRNVGEKGKLPNSLQLDTSPFLVQRATRLVSLTQ
jgi:hypothetical protein